MAWDWEDTGKSLLLAFIIWASNQLRKKIIPVWGNVKRVWNLSKIVKDLEFTVYTEKNKLQALLQISPHPIYIINEEGEMIYANQAWIDLTGYKDEKEAYGLGYLRSVHPEDRSEVSNQRKLLANSDTAYNGQVRFRNLRTHEDITRTCVSQTFKDNIGKVIGTIGTLI